MPAYDNDCQSGRKPARVTTTSASPAANAIVVRGARQNNLRNLDLELPLQRLICVTGVSGSGKSSLVFDTLYAEGQRRYVETFSPYARQFLDRMDKPAVDLLEGMPPAIAIDQSNPVRTSRSTVGTMTEINDHLKLLYARAATLYCRSCAQPVHRDDPGSIAANLLARLASTGNSRVLICFAVTIPMRMPAAEVRAELARQGYTRLHRDTADELIVIQDRLRPAEAEPARLGEAIEAALRAGHGRLSVHRLDDSGAEREVWRYSSGLHCAQCDLEYQEATPGLFSFNSPVGACGQCKGFGRVIGIDYGLVVPDEGKSLAGGAVRPWQTPSYKECQDDLLRFARLRGIPTEVPWRELAPGQREWVIAGEGEWTRKLKHWYGARRFFDWLESKAYRMHIRVLLSKYRSYTPCSACSGARLKPEALLWRLGDAPGLDIHALQLLPLERCGDFIAALRPGGVASQATALLLGELRARLGYLSEVGLGYLTLDRQSRTLSGGEVQRINLTTALGTSLVNTLFVLDEPSIGLHPRDIGRIVQVMHRLRDAGNSLLIVEHDPTVMRAADEIIDLGPGAGELGGRVVARGTPEQIMRHGTSLTGAWLDGRRRLPPLPATPAARGVAGGAGGAASLRIRNATLHNVRGLALELPLNRLVCVTGVSGSGKSTLVQDLLYPALRKQLGKPAELAGRIDIASGAEHLADVLLVDQAPIGRTTRSNPASYIGAFDEIRALFAATPDARLRRYTAGTFSFNSGTGRCAACAGNGFEHIEMQFLSDVYLRCGVCDGRRYRAETLRVKVDGAGGQRADISQVLDMTVTEALAFFGEAPKLRARLQPLADVGLDYLKLGQPVPTLSGGEAQRLKLAGLLVEAGAATGKSRGAPAGAQGKLLIFDEPTTGLHFEDVARLMGAFGKLLQAGHSLLVIEHHLDVIRAAGWVIDLGPEAGDAGGALVYNGPLAGLLRHESSHTARALRDEPAPARAAATVAEPAPAWQHHNCISVHGAREHNLCNIDVSIPREQFTVLTGVSGSGKSTLAFDIVFNEGQRRYLESLNAYARQFVQPASRADVDAVHGIPPTVAIEQRASRGGLRSTVATLTGIYHFLRLLYVHLGVQHCPDCGVPIAPQSAAAIAAQLRRRHARREVQLLAPLVAERKGIYTDLARWAAARGAAQLRVDGRFVPTDRFPKLRRYVQHTVELPVATLRPRDTSEAQLQARIEESLALGQGLLQVLDPDGRVELYSARRACPSCARSFPAPDPRLLSYNSPQGWCPDCRGTGAAEALGDEQTGEESAWLAEQHGDAVACGTCAGERLNETARHLRLDGQSIHALSTRSATELLRWSRQLRLDARAATIARDALAEIRSRIGFLERVGLGYMTLARSAPTLSGGEAQRIRLAAQLGSNLRGVCYVLDEPSIGLHPRDNLRLLDSLQSLARQRNTLLVVEHDEDTIRRADHVIDLGPGAGVQGGRVVATGTASELMQCPASITGQMLARPLRHARQPRRPVSGDSAQLRLRDVRRHNLRGLEVDIPLQRLVVVTGVSGSGKSTLARDVLHDNLARRLAARGQQALQGLKSITGAEHITRVLEVDQTPIGRTPRSCPATYVGFWDDIRRLYAGSNEARARGYNASRFSFNTPGGRCTECEGQGQRTIEMNFLPDVKVRCDRCSGARFDADTRSVLWSGRSISEVLAMNVDTALVCFAAQPRIRAALALLAEVGLGYLTLGQSSATLSGGEAQRLKLVTELARLTPDRRGTVRQTLYVLDEPTVGLHMADVERLIGVMHRLVDAGHTLVVIEHNLDVMASADWIIDLGPEAGDKGGRIVAEGPPARVAARAARSHTGKALREFLKQRAAA